MSPLPLPRRRRARRGGAGAADEPVPEEANEVREILSALERVDKAATLYPPGSSILKHHLDDAFERMTRFLARAQALDLAVAADEIEFEGEVIYDASKGQDRSNLAYTLEDGGVRRLVFLAGIERSEVQGFCDALRRSREPDADDLVTLLWVNGLRHVSYMTVEFCADPLEQSPEDILDQSQKASILDRLKNRELAIDQIAMVRGEHPPPGADGDALEIFALGPEELGLVQRRIAEYQAESGLGAYCQVVLALLEKDEDEETCRLHLASVQDSLTSLIEEGGVAVAAEVVARIRKLAESGTRRKTPAHSVALRGFVAVAAKRELGVALAEHLARGRVELSAVLAYIRALGKHAVYISQELLGGRHDAKIIAAVAEGCASDYAHIRDFVADENPHLATAAVRILSLVAGDGARVDFIRASAHKDPNVRREAFTALSRLKDPRALDRLLAAFDDVDPEIRLTALRAFASAVEKPRPELCRRIERLVAERRFAGRILGEQAALFAILGRLDPSTFVPVLARKLGHVAILRRARAQRERLAAAAALGEVATPAAEAALRAASATSDEELHAACRAALDRLELVRASRKGE